MWGLIADVDPVTGVVGGAVSIAMAVISYLQWRDNSRIKRLEEDEKRCKTDFAALKAEYAELKEKQAVDGHVLTTGIVEVNHLGTIVGADPLGCVVTGWRHDELIGQPITVLMPDATEEQRRSKSSHMEKFATAVRSPWEIRRRGLAVEMRQHDGNVIKVWVTLKGWGQNEKARFLGFIRPREDS